MKRNKIISILEYSAKNKILVGVLAISLIGVGGAFLSSHTALSNNTIGINRTVLAETLNNDGNKACVINGNDSLVLYTSASNSDIQSYISVGEMLTINSYSNGYYNVTVQETGATGYIATSNMQKIVSGVWDNLTSLSGTAYITNVSTVVNLREEATMNSTSLAKLKNDTSITLLGEQGNWYKVEYNGATGYIYGEYIAISNSNTVNNSNSNTTTSSNTSKTNGISSSSNSSTNKNISSNSGTSTQNATSSKSIYSSYFGSWTINTNPVVSIGNGIGDGSSSFPKTIFLNKSEFIYGNQIIKSPVYKIINIKASDFLGHAQYCSKIFGTNDTKSVKALVVKSSSNGANKYLFIIYNDKLLTSNGVYFYEYTLSNSPTTGIVGSTENINCKQGITSSSTSSRTEVAYIYLANGNGLVGIYKGPNENTEIKTSLESGTRVIMLGIENGFYKIEYNGNEIGYIPTTYLSFNKPTSSLSNTIKWTLNNGESSDINTVVVENTTGNNISNTALATYIREWILKSQYYYSGFADCNGTMWQSQWLDTISNSELVSSFERANGNEALSENITANELNKAAMILSDTAVKENYTPFTTEQATTYIKEMLAQAYPSQVVTKVVLHSGLYYVYTKQSGNSNPWWYVYASTGYATGV